MPSIKNTNNKMTTFKSSPQLSYLFYKSEEIPACWFNEYGA